MVLPGGGWLSATRTANVSPLRTHGVCSTSCSAGLPPGAVAAVTDDPEPLDGADWAAATPAPLLSTPAPTSTVTMLATNATADDRRCRCQPWRSEGRRRRGA